MALSIETMERVMQAHEALAPFQARLSEGEMARARGVFEWTAIGWAGDSTRPGGEQIRNKDRSIPSIYRNDNQATSSQTQITILYERQVGNGEESEAEIVMLGAVRTDQIDQALASFIDRGYELKVAENVLFEAA